MVILPIAFGWGTLKGPLRLQLLLLLGLLLLFGGGCCTAGRCLRGVAPPLAVRLSFGLCLLVGLLRLLLLLPLLWVLLRSLWWWALHDDREILL